MNVNINLHSARFQLCLLQEGGKDALEYGTKFYHFIDCSRLYIPKEKRKLKGRFFTSCLELWSRVGTSMSREHARDLLSIISKRGGVSKPIFELISEDGECFFKDIPLGSFRMLMEFVPPEAIDWNACSETNASILFWVLSGYVVDVMKGDALVDGDERTDLRETLAQWDIEAQNVLQQMYLLATTSDDEYIRFEKALNWSDEKGETALSLAVENGHVKTFEMLVTYHPLIHFDYTALQKIRRKGMFYNQTIPEEQLSADVMDSLLYSINLHHQEYLKLVSKTLQDLVNILPIDLVELIGTHLGALRDQEEKKIVVGAKRKRQDTNDE